MDFVVYLPKYNNNTIIMVIVDRFSKTRHFDMLPTQFTTSEAAENIQDYYANSMATLKVSYQISTPFF